VITGDVVEEGSIEEDGAEILKDKPIFSPIKLKDDENIWNKII
jgi:hypothetical protein